MTFWAGEQLHGSVDDTAGYKWQYKNLKFLRNSAFSLLATAPPKSDILEDFMEQIYL